MSETKTIIGLPSQLVWLLTVTFAVTGLLYIYPLEEMIASAKPVFYSVIGDVMVNQMTALWM